MDYLEEYKKYQKKLNDLSYTISILSYDLETICPKNDLKRAYEVINNYEIMKSNLYNSDEYYDILCNLINKDDLDDVTKMSVRLEHKEITKERLVPEHLRNKGFKISSDAHLNWLEGRENNDFSKFITSLDELIDYNKKVARYKDKNKEPYDVLLDMYEDDMDQNKYDEFFQLIEKELLPVLKKCQSAPKKYNTDIRNIKFDIDKQKHLTKDIAEMMGFNSDFGIIAETIHPFSNTINKDDARITTSYKEELLFSNIYSVMHEIGHAFYDLGSGTLYNNTPLFGGTSMGLHESQSRFFENYLGRKKAYINHLYELLIKYFKDELKGYTKDDIYYYVNDVTDESLRVEADELSYPFHIIIRYKVEKALFKGEIKAAGVEKYFNDLFYKYFGYYPKNLTNGAFQDVHWTGSFGYFPTYALGNAFGAQFYYSMIKEINIDKDLEEGNFKNIKDWLLKNIHIYGRSKKNFEVIWLATKEKFNPEYYIKYLKDKFNQIYDLKEEI
mgnify:CR=1 FL=1